MTDAEMQVVHDLRLAVVEAVEEHVPMGTPMTAILAGIVEGLAAVSVDLQLEEKTLDYPDIWDALRDVYVSNASEMERQAVELIRQETTRPH